MIKSKNLGLNLPSRDNTTDLADINVVSENFETIDNEFENVYNKLNNTGVVNTVSGSPLVLKDSANAPLQQLKLYGHTEQNETPTPDAPIPLVSVGDSGSFEVGMYGRNVLVNTATTLTANGVTFTVNEDKSVTVKGTSTTWTHLKLNQFILPKGNYIITLDGGIAKALYPTVRDTSNNLIVDGYRLTQNGFDFTLSENKEVWVTVSVAPNVTVDTTVYPMIRSADITDGTYEPCNKQTLPILHTLRSVPNANSEGTALGVGETTDIVDFNKGIKTENILKVTLDGTESMREHANGMLYVKLYGDKTNYKFRTGCGLCDQLTNCFGVSTGNVFHIGTEGVYVGKCTKYSTVEELKAYLQTNPMTFYIAITTPQETPLTETELNAYKKLHTNKPTTTILSEADMEVSYVADTKLYIDNKIAELTALTLEV